MNRFSLEGKNAVVCGGLGLIGKEISLTLSQSKAKVLILDINENEWNIFHKKNKETDNIDFLRFDITDIKNSSKTLEEINKKYGGIHIWINTAYPRTKDWGEKLDNIKIDSFQKNVDMHLNTYCLLTRDVAEMMKENNIKGSIINFASIYGIVGPTFSIYDKTNMTTPAAYSAIKGGIINFNRYTAAYYGKYGIRTNVISPGGIYNNQSEKFIKNYQQRTPLCRMGYPEDLAGAVIFLASDASSYITGHNLVVDGGWTVW